MKNVPVEAKSTSTLPMLIVLGVILGVFGVNYIIEYEPETKLKAGQCYYQNYTLGRKEYVVKVKYSFPYFSEDIQYFTQTYRKLPDGEIRLWGNVDAWPEHYLFEESTFGPPIITECPKNLPIERIIRKVR